MSKTFELAVKSANDDQDDRLPFQIEGSEEQLYAYRPTEGQLVLLMGVMSEFEKPEQQAATVLDVFWSLLDEDTVGVVRRRLRDRNDTFGLLDVMNIIEWIVEETAARPTQSSLASLPSRATSGHLSTGGVQRKRSTRSASRPIASTT
jgi:hypothetical protein